MTTFNLESSLSKFLTRSWGRKSFLMARQQRRRRMSFELPSFEPLDEGQVEFLKQRTVSVLEVVPKYRKLREKLLGFGGIEVVPPVIDLSSAGQLARQSYDVTQVLQAGRTWPGEQAEIKVVETNNCHLNVARLRTSGHGHIVSGWALPMDGLWREHSWMVSNIDTPGESLIETTVSWLLYYGYVLSEEEEDWFIRAELGSNPLKQ